MHSVIFVAENPKPDAMPHQTEPWNELLRTLKDIVDTSPGTVMLSHNLLQIPLESALPALIRCGEACRAQTCTYSCSLKMSHNG